MTLRLVNASDRALPCRYTCGGQNPATMLLSLSGQPALPCCDRCARAYYDLRPDVVQMGPLDGYVDMFAAAREAALATPEQITSPGQAQPAAAGVPARNHTGLWVTAGILMVVLISGIALASHGNTLNQSSSGGGMFVATGAILIVLSALPLAIGGLIAVACAVQDANQRQATASRQNYAPQQGSSVPWYQHPDVVNAALVSGVVIASHEASKHHKARLRNSALGIAPLNNAAAGAKHGTYLAGQPDDTQEGIRYELEQLNTANPKWTRP